MKTLEVRREAHIGEALMVGDPRGDHFADEIREGPAGGGNGLGDGGNERYHDLLLSWGRHVFLDRLTMCSMLQRNKRDDSTRAMQVCHGFQ